MRAARQMDLSVVIATHNRSTILRHVLQALLLQNWPADRYEVLVVDDHSTDDTILQVADLEKGFPQHTLRCFSQESGKKGPAAANNLGVYKAQSRFVLFLNDDVIAQPELITEHVRLNKRYPNRVIQGGVQLSSDLDYPETRSPGYIAEYRNVEFGHFTTWNCSVKRSLLLQVGGFNESFVDPGWEDIELGRRLRRHGVGEKRQAKALAYHYKKTFRPADLPGIQARALQNGRNAALFYRLHPQLAVYIMTYSFMLWLVRLDRRHRDNALRLNKVSAVVAFLFKKERHRCLKWLLNRFSFYWYLIGLKEGASVTNVGSPVAES